MVLRQPAVFGADGGRGAGGMPPAGSRFRLPRLPRKLAPRDRLMRRLDAMAPLTVVHALPGSGKTTLVAVWAHQQRVSGTRVVWIRADPALSAPGAFALLLSEALGSTDKPVLVVIDDAHQVEGPDHVEVLLDLLACHPSLHAVLCADGPHPVVQAARLRQVGTTVLTGRDLSVDADELRHCAEAWGHLLDGRRLAELRSAVGGWLGPARLVLDRTGPEAAGLDFSEARHFIDITVPPVVDERGLLSAAIRLALVGDFSQDVAEAILGRAHADADHVGVDSTPGPRTPSALALLEFLEEHGLLEASRAGSGGPQLWRFPTLVGCVLTKALTSMAPDKVAALHRDLAEAVASSGDPRTWGRVLALARAGGHWGLLARIWVEHGLRLAAQDPDAVVHAYSGLPAEVLALTPMLAVASAIAITLPDHADVARRRRLLRHHLRAVGQVWQEPHAGEVTDERVLIVAGALAARRGEGDSARALRLADALDEELRRSVARQEHRPNPVNVAWFELQWGATALAADDRQVAMAAFTRAFTTAAAWDAPFVASQAAAQLASLHAHMGDTPAAAVWLEEHAQLAHGGADRRPQSLHVTRAMLHLDRLDRAATEQALQATGDGSDSVEGWAQIVWVQTRYTLLFGEPLAMLEHLAHLSRIHAQALHGGGLARRTVDRCVSDLLVALGELNRAERLISDAATSGSLAVPEARLALIAGDHRRARGTARAAVWSPETDSRDRIELLFIESVAALAMGDDEVSTQAFVRGQALAERIGTLVPLAAIPERARDQLLGRAGGIVPDQDLARLRSCRSVYPDTAELVVLSPRETVVLHGMVDHETVAEIAAALTVSVNTVKKQLASIYSKLGVGDRASAILRAHELGLLAAQRRP